jgi:hypothetical protein
VEKVAALVFLAALMAGTSSALAENDLDAFMSRVLSRRDENWKKLQQYVLEERETLRVRGPSGVPIYGFEREYSWFARDGVFIRSPLRADGVIVPEDGRRRAEEEWLKREQRREPQQPSPEPQFVSAAYFLKFKFDPGQYALVGREMLDDRMVLRIEYYPTKLFTEGRSRPNRRLRDKDDEITGKMNKVALVTLWIDPGEHQILQYEFHNIDADFLPGRSLVRLEDVSASMRMGQPFPGVWLPKSLAMRFGMTLATGAVNAHYDVEYYDYKLADVTYRVR